MIIHIPVAVHSICPLSGNLSHRSLLDFKTSVLELVPRALYPTLKSISWPDLVWNFQSRTAPALVTLTGTSMLSPGSRTRVVDFGLEDTVGAFLE